MPFVDSLGSTQHLAMPLFGGSSAAGERPEGRPRRSHSKRPDNPFRTSEAGVASPGRSGNRENARGPGRKRKSCTDGQGRRKAAFSLFSPRFGGVLEADSAGQSSPEQGKKEHAPVGLMAGSAPEAARKENRGRISKRTSSPLWKFNMFSSGRQPKAARRHSEGGQNPAQAQMEAQQSSNPFVAGIANALPGPFLAPNTLQAMNGPIVPFGASMPVDNSPTGRYMPNGSFVPFGASGKCPNPTGTSKVEGGQELFASGEGAELLDSVSYGESSADSNFAPSLDADDSRDLYSTTGSANAQVRRSRPGNSVIPDERPSRTQNIPGPSVPKRSRLSHEPEQQRKKARTARGSFKWISSLFRNFLPGREGARQAQPISSPSPATSPTLHQSSLRTFGPQRGLGSSDREGEALSMAPFNPSSTSLAQELSASASIWQDVWQEKEQKYRQIGAPEVDRIPTSTHQVFENAQRSRERKATFSPRLQDSIPAPDDAGTNKYGSRKRVSYLSDEIVVPPKPPELHGLDLRQEQLDLNKGHLGRQMTLQNKRPNASPTREPFGGVGNTLASGVAGFDGRRAGSIGGVSRNGGDPVADFLRGLSVRAPAADRIPRRLGGGSVGESSDAGGMVTFPTSSSVGGSFRNGGTGGGNHDGMSATFYSRPGDSSAGHRPRVRSDELKSTCQGRYDSQVFRHV